MIIEIDNIKIGEDQPPYIIAEISANHNGDIKNAIKLIDMAKDCGANAVKLQSYTPDTITLDSNNDDFIIEGGLWDGRRLYDLYAEAFLPWEWHKPLFDHARNKDITIFSSVFDNSSVDFLEDLNTPAYKIASFEAIDLPLIKYTASTGKPMIISTGLADKKEIEEAIFAARDSGCKQLAILHCVSGYPAPSSDYNLMTIKDMKNSFRVVTGLSDHTISNTTALASISLGASIIEKHITLDRTGGGPDDSFSLEKEDLAELCKESRIASEAVGNVNDIKSGSKIQKEDLRSVRPGYGLAPKKLDAVIGKRALKDIQKHTPVQIEDFK